MPQKPKSPRKSVTIREAAAMLDVHEQTVRRALERGELQGFRQTLRGNFRVYVDSIEELLKARELTPLPK